MSSAEISCEEGGVLELSTGINGQITNSGVAHFDRMEARVFEHCRMFLECGCDDGQILSVMTVWHRGRAGNLRHFIWSEERFIRILKGTAPGEVWTISKYTLFDVENRKESSGKTDGQVLVEMTDVLAEALKAGYGELNRRHRDAFERFWDMAAIEITGGSQKKNGQPLNLQSIIWPAWFHGREIPAR